jgi:hypothetical protein
MSSLQGIPPKTKTQSARPPWGQGPWVGLRLAPLLLTRLLLCLTSPLPARPPAYPPAHPPAQAGTCWACCGAASAPSTAGEGAPGACLARRGVERPRLAPRKHPPRLRPQTQSQHPPTPSSPPIKPHLPSFQWDTYDRGRTFRFWFQHGGFNAKQSWEGLWAGALPVWFAEQRGELVFLSISYNTDNVNKDAFRWDHVSGARGGGVRPRAEAQEQRVAAGVNERLARGRAL